MDRASASCRACCHPIFGPSRHLWPTAVSGHGTQLVLTMDDRKLASDTSGQGGCRQLLLWSRCRRYVSRHTANLLPGWTSPGHCKVLWPEPPRQSSRRPDVQLFQPLHLWEHPMLREGRLPQEPDCVCCSRKYLLSFSALPPNSLHKCTG